MEIKVKVKKTAVVKMSIREVADTIRYLSLLQIEQEKLPNGADEALKYITRKFDAAYKTMAYATDNTENAV